MEKYKFNRLNSEWLRYTKDRTSQFLAKVDGGRCKNNKPSKVRSKGDIVDIDISGCYATTMKSIGYAIGNPAILDYPKARNSNKPAKGNQYFTLREFLKYYGKELVPNRWIARVSTIGYLLNYPQDLIMSWYPPKKIEDMVSDSDKDGWDILNLENDGESKVFKREIHLGILTTDILEIIEYQTSPKQRKELLDNLYVVSAMYFPASEKKDSLKEVIEASDQYPERNYCRHQKVNGKIQKINIEETCHAWCELPLQEYMELLSNERKKYRKDNPDEFPLNKVMKDCLNTPYGDIVSRYFLISNTVIGNNITARARVMAWCIEKGLNTYQVITDGGMFDKDRIVTENRAKITLENSIDEKGLNEGNLKLKSLEGSTKKELEENAIAHLKSLFPNLSIFQNNVYELEIKEESQNEYIAQGLATHGSADYLLNYPNNPKYKMRGYNEKTYDLEGNKVDLIHTFLNDIFNNPDKVGRLKPCLESYILKTKEYPQYSGCEIYIGDNVIKAKFPIECSISALTFQTKKQKDSWEKAIERLRDSSSDRYGKKYGQALEMFFLNEDGTLDYEGMMKELHQDVEAGKMKPSCLEDKNCNNSRKYQSHPYLEQYQQIKDYKRNINGHGRIEGKDNHISVDMYNLEH